LINLININNAAFGSVHIIITYLEEACENALYVFTNVTCFSKYRGIYNGERNIQHASDAFCKQGLSGTGFAYHYDIALFNLDLTAGIGIGILLLKSFVVIVYGYCQHFLCFVLANYVLIKKFFNLDRFLNCKLK